jgi:hypothetical protein
MPTTFEITELKAAVDTAAPIRFSCLHDINVNLLNSSLHVALQVLILTPPSPGIPKATIGIVLSPPE